jgi:hypothetical protein
MILHRLSDALREQDWFTVIVEILIVVIGVFIGLQVNNWNQARLEARQSGVFTERLLADLRIEAWNYDTIIGYLAEVQSNADRALAVLDGSLVATDEEFLIYAYRATQYSDVLRRRATYDELTSTGTIGLIRDSFLRDTAATVYTVAFIDRISGEGINAPYRIAFRKLLPVGVQETLASDCGDRIVPIGDFGAIRDQLDYECKTTLTPEQIELAAKQLRTDPEILPLLRLQAVNLRTHIGLFTFANRDLMNSLHAIAKQAP